MSDLESTVQQFTDDFKYYIEEVSERNPNKLNPLVEKYSVETFHDWQEKLFENKEEPSHDQFVISEFASQRALADLLNYNEDDDSKSLLVKIGLLLDFVIFLRSQGKAYKDCVILLTEKIIRNLSFELLLDFWDAIDLRIDEIKYVEEGKGIDVKKKEDIRFSWINFQYYSKALLVSINFRIDQLKQSHDEKKDIMRSKLLKFTSDIFPLFSEPLINKDNRVNEERRIELPKPQAHTSKSYKNFLQLMIVLSNPFKYKEIYVNRAHFENDVSNFLETIASIERDAFEKEVDPDNQIATYERLDLSEENRQTLINFYKQKPFNPSFNLTEENFFQQLRNDPFTRRAILFQIIIFINAVLLAPRSKRENAPRPSSKIQEELNHSLSELSFPELQSFSSRLKPRCQDLLSSIERRLMFTMMHIRDWTEPAWFSRKLKDFNFALSDFQSLEMNEEFKEKLQKREKLPARFWSKLGTPEITKHWQIKTGLDLLEKSAFDYNLDNLPNQVEKLQNEMNDEVKDLNTWKSYRLIKKFDLFKFKQIDQYTGLDGYFNPDLKAEMAEKIETEREEERLKEEQLSKEREEIRKQKEEEEKKKRGLEEQELAKKRKLEEEKFEEIKKARLQEAASTAPSSEIDY